MRRRPSEVSRLRGGANSAAPAAARDHSSTPIPSIRKGSIVKRIFCLPVLAGSIALAAALASLSPITSSRVYAQDRYTTTHTAKVPTANTAATPAHLEPMATCSRTRRDVRQCKLRILRLWERRVRLWQGVDYGIGPPVRVYGGSSYYQPSYDAVYVPFGYGVIERVVALWRPLRLSKGFSTARSWAYPICLLSLASIRIIIS